MFGYDGRVVRSSPGSVDATVDERDAPERLLGEIRKFGVLLESLADVNVFVVAPAITMFR